MKKAARIAALVEALQAAERHLTQELEDDTQRHKHPINQCPVLDQVRRALASWFYPKNGD